MGSELPGRRETNPSHRKNQARLRGVCYRGITARSIRQAATPPLFVPCTSLMVLRTIATGDLICSCYDLVFYFCNSYFHFSDLYFRFCEPVFLLLRLVFLLFQLVVLLFQLVLCPYATRNLTSATRPLPLQLVFWSLATCILAFPTRYLTLQLIF